MTDSSQVNEFIKAQIVEWPIAAGNFAALTNVKIKEFDVDGMRIKVQFNPARIVSSAAKVDADSLKTRKCFLCAENRPEEQRRLPWKGDEYSILINPYPIFPRHLTISSNNHRDQLIKGRMADMIRLASELDEYTVFYNGPKCGASAPDHMHFQAGNSDFLTLAENLEAVEHNVLAQIEGSTLSFVDKYPMKMFVIDAINPDHGEMLFNRLYAALPLPVGESEPMMNILAYSAPFGVRIVVIPRKRHRPSFYGMEGDGCMVLSPASVDMGGVFITPRQQDFERIDKNLVRRVYKELCLSQKEAEFISQNIWEDLSKNRN